MKTMHFAHLPFLTAFFLATASVHAEGPLPRFTFQGVALEGPIADGVERHLLIEGTPDSAIANRFRGGEFYQERETICLYSSVGENPRVIGYSTGVIEKRSAAQRVDTKP